MFSSHIKLEWAGHTRRDKRFTQGQYSYSARIQCHRWLAHSCRQQKTLVFPSYFASQKGHVSWSVSVSIEVVIGMLVERETLLSCSFRETRNLNHFQSNHVWVLFLEDSYILRTDRTGVFERRCRIVGDTIRDVKFSVSFNELNAYPREK